MPRVVSPNGTSGRGAAQITEPLSGGRRGSLSCPGLRGPAVAVDGHEVAGAEPRGRPSRVSAVSRHDGLRQPVHRGLDGRVADPVTVLQSLDDEFTEFGPGDMESGTVNCFCAA